MKAFFVLSFFVQPSQVNKYSRPKEIDSLDRLMGTELAHFGAEDIKHLFPGTITFSDCDDNCDLEEVLNKWNDRISAISGVEYFIAPLTLQAEDDEGYLALHQAFPTYVQLATENANVELIEIIQGGSLDHFADYKIIEQIEEKFSYLYVHKTNRFKFLTCVGGTFKFYEIVPNWHKAEITDSEIETARRTIFNQEIAKTGL